MRLKDVCNVFLDGDWIENKDQSPAGIRLIQTGNIGNGIFLEKKERARFISEETFARLKCNEIFPGDILVSRLPDPIGRACIIPDTDERMITAVDCTICRVDKSMILPEFLCYFMRSAMYCNAIMENVTGTTRKRISRKNLGNVNVRLFPLDDQQAIIHKLDYITKIIKLRKKELAQLDYLIKARFIELFGDLKSNSKGWPIVGFNECAEIDTNMIHDFEGYEDYPHIGIDSIEKETGRLSGYRTVAEDGVISGKYLFTEKHIIYSKIRPNLNKVAMPDFVGVCSADAYPILVKDDICVKEYLGYTMRSKYFLDYILAFSNRTNLPKVNKKQVEGFALPLPPMELQQQFAAFVSQLDKSKAAVQKALDETQLLFDSLMQEYFG